MCYRWIARDNCEETLRALFGTLAYDKRQIAEARWRGGFEHGAIGGDQRDGHPFAKAQTVGVP